MTRPRYRRKGGIRPRTPRAAYLAHPTIRVAIALLLIAVAIALITVTSERGIQ